MSGRAAVAPTDGNEFLLATPRALRASERALAEFLIDEPFPGRDQLRRQLDSARVRDEGAEDCATIGIAVDRSLPPTPAEAVTVPVDAEGRDTDGMPILFVLHAPDGYLRELEVVRFDGEPPRSMPPVASLRRRINHLPREEG